MSESNKSTFENRMDALISAIKDYIKILSNYYKNYKKVTVGIMSEVYGFVNGNTMIMSELKEIRDKFPNMIKNILSAIPQPKEPTLYQKVKSFFITQTQKPDEAELQLLQEILTKITTNYGNSTNLWLGLINTLPGMVFKNLQPANNLVNILKQYLDLQVNFFLPLNGFNKIAKDALKKVDDCETRYEQAEITANKEIQSKNKELSQLKIEQKFYQFPLTVLQKIQKNQIPKLGEIREICKCYEPAADVLTMICVLEYKLDKIPSCNANAYNLENNGAELLNQLKKSRPQYSEGTLKYVLEAVLRWFVTELKTTNGLIYPGFQKNLIEYMEIYSDKLVAGNKRKPNIPYLKKLGTKMNQTLEKICNNLNNIHTRNELKSWKNLFNAQNFFTLPNMMKKYHNSYHKLVETYENVDALTLGKEVAKKTTEVKKHYNEKSEDVQKQIEELDNKILKIRSQLRDAQQKYENARSTAKKIALQVKDINAVINELFYKN